jgi:hypothetical protein
MLALVGKQTLLLILYEIQPTISTHVMKSVEINIPDRMNRYPTTLSFISYSLLTPFTPYTPFTGIKGLDGLNELKNDRHTNVIVA